MFAAEIRKRWVRGLWYSNWGWHLDEVFVRINGKTYYLWRAVDHEGEVLEVFAPNGGMQGCTQVSETRDETLWPAGFDRHGQASVLTAEE